MEMKKIIAGLGVFALSLSVAPFASADTITGTNTTGNMVAAHDIQLEVEVLDTLSLDCYDSAGASGDHVVTLGDTTTGAGYVVSGVPSVGASTCEVLTNDDQGYFLTIEKSTEDVVWADDDGVGVGTTTGGTVLTHEDVNTDGLWYNIPDLAAYSYTAAAPGGSVWDTGTNLGLGFSVIRFPDTSIANNDFDGVWVEGQYGIDVCMDGTSDPADANDDAVYAGVPVGPQAIAAVPEYASTETFTEVCYKVDVPSTQQSGEYAGQVTFTATTDAATYLN